MNGAHSFTEASDCHTCTCDSRERMLLATIRRQARTIDMLDWALFAVACVAGAFFTLWQVAL